MLKLNKLYLLKTITYYNYYTAHLNKYSLSKIKKVLSLYNLYIYTVKKPNLVHVRSPKHFNKGKNRFILLKSFLVYKKSLNISSSISSQYKNYYTLFNIFSVSPSLKNHHLKVQKQYTFKLIIN